MDLLRVPDPSSVSGGGQECPEPQRVTYPCPDPHQSWDTGTCVGISSPMGHFCVSLSPHGCRHPSALPVIVIRSSLPFTPTPITGSRAATLAQTAHLPTTCNVVANVATYCATPSR